MTPTEAKKNLQEAVRLWVRDAGAVEACNQVLELPAFNTWPAAEKHHHVYEGGLMVHTAEVLGNALWHGNLHRSLEILTCAAVFHDVMKIKDYEKVDGVWQKTKYAKQVYHPAGSYAEWIRACSNLSIDKELADAVGHCILSHHGRKDWGAIQEPQTKEALILHFADMLSAFYGEGR